MKNHLAVPQKANTELLCIPAIPLLDIYLEGLKAGTWTDTCTPVLKSSIIHHSQRVETNQMSINRLMDKQNVVYTSNGILFNH